MSILTPAESYDIWWGFDWNEVYQKSM